MNCLHLDLCGGIAGDMLLGLLLDLGLERQQLEADLAQLQIPGWQLEISRESRLGISGTRVEVKLSGTQPPRNWKEIDGLLGQSSLPPEVTSRARAVFRRLGEAEARIHGTSLQKVHFHEVGAVDALVDIVGSVAGLFRLGIDRLTAASIPLGFGSNRCAHGDYPLPAPATVALLQGWPVHDAGCDKELVTPTGAALLATLGEPAALPSMTLHRTGYGVGGWDLADRPNLLRGLLGDTPTTQLEQDEICVLESNVDDGNPEWLGDLMGELIAAGALDVSFTAAQMKKQRPGTLVTVLCPIELEAELSNLLLLGSGSSGVRSRLSRRFKLGREQRQIETELGPAEVKLFLEGSRPVRITAEYESCKALAQQHRLPLPEVYRRVERAAAELLTPDPVTPEDKQ